MRVVSTCVYSMLLKNKSSKILIGAGTTREVIFARLVKYHISPGSNSRTGSKNIFTPGFFAGSGKNHNSPGSSRNRE